MKHVEDFALVIFLIGVLLAMIFAVFDWLSFFEAFVLLGIGVIVIKLYKE